MRCHWSRKVFRLVSKGMLSDWNTVAAGIVAGMAKTNAEGEFGAAGEIDFTG